jgi:CRISPR-associated endonuclease/helicase Cas3
MEDNFIAHVRKEPDGSWATPHSLLVHLENTAKIAEQFCAKFDSSLWGKVLALAHDAGKGRVVWQNYLVSKSGYYPPTQERVKKGVELQKDVVAKEINIYAEEEEIGVVELEEATDNAKSVRKIPHAIQGAKLVEELYGKGLGRLLSYCIAGHHAGLPDFSSAEGAGKSALSYQLAQIKDTGDIAAFIKEALKKTKPSSPPWFFEPGLDLSLWIRMLYSALVDADFLDTEAYMNAEKFNNRGSYASISELQLRFNSYITALDARAKDTSLNKTRRDIRTKCVIMAKREQGVFSLSVPTGGGKTLSSLAFALEHAIIHKLNRVIYVVPYTSIIEQNAEVFRSVLGADQVVEHHSNIIEDDSGIKSRLASENWDAPVIITTSVQFFESLFAAKPSQCRKLHNIIGTVVILDEAQLVPVEYLAPILETMQLLVERYKVTFLISTATQPAFTDGATLNRKFKGLKDITEIMGDSTEVKSLYQSLERVQIYFPKELHIPTPWEDVAHALKQYDQVLCIVSDRKSCRELFSLMPPGTFHLSALMCGQHRSEKIREIKDKLKMNEPIRVISTQLVEAGVDLDFPVVYRAFAGLDAIVQAAGRCNREGKLQGLGKVVIFNPPRKPPQGLLRKAAETTANIVLTQKDPVSHEVFYQYFSELYWKANSLDEKEIITLLDPVKNDKRECSIFFKSAALRFSIINDSLQKTILVPYKEGEGLINLLKHKGPERRLMRQLQRYTVNVYNHDFNHLYQRGAVEEVCPGIFVLVTSLDYAKDIGVLVEETPYDPESYIL